MTLLITYILIYWAQMPWWMYLVATWVWVTKWFLVGWSRLDD